MKSIRHVRVLTYTAIAVIFLLQGIWTLKTYQLIEIQLFTQMNDVFNKSVYSELTIRMDTPSSFSPQTDSMIIYDSAIDKTYSQDIDFNQNVSIILQEHLSILGQRLSLHNLDSIFHSEIAQLKLHGTFIINHLNPNTGEVLETTDPKGKGMLKGALASEIIPIRSDGSEGVQVLLISPFQSVFRLMLFALFLSFLLVIFVGYSLFFVMRSYSKERQLRRLQTDFSHALTHNMASPLHTIANVNNLLGNEKVINDPEKRNHFIHLAQQQIMNLQALTNRILTIANAEESKLKIEPETVNLNDMVCSLTEKFNLQAAKKIHFETHFSPDIVLLQADNTLLQDAISNLMDNAIKYSGETVHINIRGEQNKTGTFVYIKDDGYGISEKDQTKIFAKFERGKAVKRNEARGFGLGLSFVKEVVQVHGGSINLFSKEGKGSEFVLYLPFTIKNNTDKTGLNDKDTLG